MNLEKTIFLFKGIVGHFRQNRNVSWNFLFNYYLKLQFVGPLFNNEN